MPNTNGVNGVEVWMVICIVMVFSALSEYGLLLYIMTYQLKTKKNDKESMNDIKNNRIFLPVSATRSHNRNEKDVVSTNKESIQKQDDLREENHADNLPMATEMKLKNTMRKIDSISLFLFPLVFLSLIFVYLIVFLN